MDESLEEVDLDSDEEVPLNQNFVTRVTQKGIYKKSSHTRVIVHQVELICN